MVITPERFEKYRDDMIDIQRRMVEIPALSADNGGDGEYRKSREMIKILNEYEINDIEEYNCPDDTVPDKVRPNLVGRIKGKDSSKTLWIMSHLDVVPAGELSLWDSDPFVLKVESDRVIGRGVEDNHIGIVMSMIGAKYLTDNNITPFCDIGLLFVADEETGSLRGLNYVLENTDIFKSDDLFWVPDSGSPEGAAIEIAEKSIMWLKFKIKGKQCHASRPSLGINAMKAGAELIVSLDGLHQEFSKTDPLYTPPHSTFEPTKKERNVDNVNTIPGDDIFYFDCRILPDYKVDDVMAFISRNVDKIVEKYGVTVDISSLQEVIAPPPTPEDSEVVDRLRSAIQHVLKTEPKVMGIGGGTVASFFRRKGFPVAVYTKIDEVAHSPNEYIKFDDMYKNSAIAAHVMAGQP